MVKLDYKVNPSYSMRIQAKKQKNGKKALITIIIAVLILATAYGFVAHAKNFWPFHQDTINLKPASNDEKNAGTQIKSSAVTPNATKTTPSNDANPNTKAIGVSFSATSQDTNVYHIRLLIDQVVGAGTCSLSMTSTTNGQDYTATANIQAGPSSSTCEGFDIPLSKLSAGNWNATVSVISGNAAGSATKEITIK